MKRLLIVDDEKPVLHALCRLLQRHFTPQQLSVELCADPRQALQRLLEVRFDVLISDHRMPQMDGITLLARARELDPRTVRIMLSAAADFGTVLAAVNRAEVFRYIPKPWDEPDLRLTVENLLKTFRLHRQNELLFEDLKRKNTELELAKSHLEEKVKERTQLLEEANARLNRLAVTDGLTGLYNHRYFHEQLQQAVERSLRSGIPVALLMIDVDHFKKYNDRQGHPAGDEALRTVARLISEDRRTVDVSARYGGEEFAIVLHDVTRDGAVEVADKIRARVAAAPIAHADKQPLGRLTVSIGVAACPQDAQTAEALLEAADVALYRAKKSGRDTVVQAGTR